MTTKTPEIEALQRPQKLKAWSADLVDLVDGQAEDLFTGWTFGPGALTRNDFDHILKKVGSCGSILELRAAVNHATGEVGAPVLHAANFCGQHTICPFCAARIQDRRLAKWKKPIEWAASEYRYAYMVTATTSPAETWRAGIDGLRDAWREFYLKGQKRGDGRSGGEWGKVKAGIAKMEIKRGEGSGLPHCHYHAIVFTSEPLDYRVWSPEEKKKPIQEREPLFKIPWRNDRGFLPASKLSYEWSESTGFTAVDFDCRPIKWNPKHQAEGVSYAESVFMQSVEVLKYATKFDSSPATGAEKLFAADFIGIKDATYNRRLFHTYGAFQRQGKKDPSSLCPFLLQEDDFEGGGPQLCEGPLIFESRWQSSRRYSDLVEKSLPVFRGQERSLKNQYRRTMLNRLQGKHRRMRNAILESKKFFQEDGDLVRACYMEIEYDAQGEKVLRPAVLEFPAYVVENPEDFSNWERWVDELTAGAREAHKALREFLGIDDEARADEVQRAADLAAEWYLRSRAYHQEITRSFLEVLDMPERMIPAPAPP